MERPPILPALSPLHAEEEPLVGPVEVADQPKGDEDLPKPRRKRTGPFLNDDRLSDRKRGLAYLVKEFPKIKFKGKGHEASDVRYLMRSYEHWANRLFPKFPFDKFLRTLEGPLTSKKGVKACMQRLRRRELEDNNEITSEEEDRNADGHNQATRPVDQMVDFGGEVRTVQPPPPGHMTMATPSPEQIMPPPPNNDRLELMQLHREQAMACLAARRAAHQTSANGQENDTQETEHSHHDEEMDTEHDQTQAVHATNGEDSGLAQVET